MKKWPGYILPIFILVFVFGNLLKKPKERNDFGAVQYDGEMYWSETSLSDTLGAGVVSAMQVTDVTGIRLQKDFHQFAAYFEYQGSVSQVLEVLSSLPTPIHYGGGDVTCGELPFQDFLQMTDGLTAEEVDGSSSFWSVSVPADSIYRCYKPPFRHTLIVNTTGTVIKHRVEYNG